MANIPTANNNPGDIRAADGSFNIGAKTPLEGQAKLYNDLTAKMTGKSTTGLNGDSTLYEFVQKYAPRGDGSNNPEAYTADLANKLKISPDTKIGTLMPRIDDFAHAISQHEGYKGSWVSGNPVSDTQGSQASQPSGNGFLPVTPPANASSYNAPVQLTSAELNPTATKKTLNTGNAVADVMGMGAFGKGLATAGRTIAGHGNDEGNAQGGALQALSAIMAKFPQGSAARKQAIAQYQKTYGGGKQVAGQSAIPTQAEIDPGTTLKNKDVGKSAATTALWALSGASKPFAGMKSGLLASRAGGVGTPLIASAISKTAGRVLPLLTRITPLFKGLAEAGVGAGILKELWDLNHKQ